MVSIRRDITGTDRFSINDREFKTFRDYTETLKLLRFCKDALLGKIDIINEGVLPAALVKPKEEDASYDLPSGDELISGDGTIIFRHSLHVSTYDKKEFVKALYSSIKENVDLWSIPMYQFASKDSIENHRRRAKRAIDKINELIDQLDKAV